MSYDLWKTKQIKESCILYIGPPLNVTLKSRGKTSLEVSWKAPDKSFQNSELTGYQVCFYTSDTTPECLVVKSSKVLSLTLYNLQPSTKYFVTVSAITKASYGEKSLEVSKITNGGNYRKKKKKGYPLKSSASATCSNLNALTP